jgi:hypothetical protein
MTDTIWRQRKADEAQPEPNQLHTENVSDELGVGGSGAMLIMPGGKPDWIKDPQTGAPMRCTSYFRTTEPVTCPLCKTQHQSALMFSLDSDGHPGYEWVGIHCPACQKYAHKLCRKEE